MCEIRHVNLQGSLDRVVADHRPSLATLRFDLEWAIPRVGKMWEELFPDPRKIHGQAFLSAKVIWSGHFEKTQEYRAGLRIVDSEPEEHEVFLRFYNFLALQKRKALS